MNILQLFTILFAIKVGAMPQIHRMVVAVSIEFEAYENLETLLHTKHVIIVSGANVIKNIKLP